MSSDTRSKLCSEPAREWEKLPRCDKALASDISKKLIPSNPQPHRGWANSHEAEWPLAAGYVPGSRELTWAIPVPMAACHARHGAFVLGQSKLTGSRLVDSRRSVGLPQPRRSVIVVERCWCKLMVAHEPIWPSTQNRSTLEPS